VATGAGALDGVRGLGGLDGFGGFVGEGVGR